MPRSSKSRTLSLANPRNSDVSHLYQVLAKPQKKKHQETKRDERSCDSHEMQNASRCYSMQYSTSSELYADIPALPRARNAVYAICSRFWRRDTPTPTRIENDADRTSSIGWKWSIPLLETRSIRGFDFQNTANFVFHSTKINSIRARLGF